MLVPGNMCDGRLWEPVAKELEQAGYPVRHAPRLDQPTIEAMTQAVLDDIDEPVVVVGFSMGAIVAAELARIKPERITALGLVAFNASSDLPERAAVRPRQQGAVRMGHLEAIVADELKPNYLADQNKQDPHLLATVMEMARAPSVRKPSSPRARPCACAATCGPHCASSPCRSCSPAAARTTCVHRNGIASGLI